jgi:hypothetical protein
MITLGRKRVQNCVQDTFDFGSCAKKAGMAGDASDNMGVFVVNLPDDDPLSPGTSFGCGETLVIVLRFSI